MNRVRRRELDFLVAFVAIVAVYTVLYKLGMQHLDGRPRGWAHSFGVIIESMTSTGYGSDSPWRHWAMELFMPIVQLTGVVAIFAAIPVIILPLFERALSERAPRSIPELTDHVVLCEYTDHGETLVEELEAREVDYVIVESDADEADRLYEDGLSVVYGDPERTSTLRGVNLKEARALLADSGDEENASIVLAGREVDADVPIVSIVEDLENAVYHEYSGADRVISPERILGQSLADKVSTRVTSRFETVGDGADEGTSVPVGDAEAQGAFEIAELSIQRGSSMCTDSLASSGIREETGANVIGVWDGGTFESPADPDTVLTEGTVLLAAGRPEQLRALAALAEAPKRRHRSGDVVVVGLGEVGSTVVSELAGDDIDPCVVDRRDAPGVDVVGDASDTETLEAAGVADAETIVLSLDDDTSTIFTLLVARQLNPDAELVVRANDVGNVPKMYHAGADYVLALTTISGRMLASIVLDEDVLTLDTQVALVRTPVPALTGQTLAEADVRARSGVTIVAVERDGTVLSSLEPDFRLQSGDVVVVAGTDEDINSFQAWAAPDDD